MSATTYAMIRLNDVDVAVLRAQRRGKGGGYTDGIILQILSTFPAGSISADRGTVELQEVISLLPHAFEDAQASAKSFR